MDLEWKLMMAGKRLRRRSLHFRLSDVDAGTATLDGGQDRLSTHYGPLTTPKLRRCVSTQSSGISPGTSAGLGPYLAPFSLTMSGPACLSDCVCHVVKLRPPLTYSPTQGATVVQFFRCFSLSPLPWSIDTTRQLLPVRPLLSSSPSQSCRVFIVTPVLHNKRPVESLPACPPTPFEAQAFCTSYIVCVRLRRKRVPTQETPASYLYTTRERRSDFLRLKATACGLLRHDLNILHSIYVDGMR
jgi:hypothetical protein